MPDVTITLTIKVRTDSPDKTVTTTFTPATNLEPARATDILEEAAKRLQGQDRLPLDAGDTDPAYVASPTELDPQPAA